MKKVTAGICAIALATAINAPIYGEHTQQNPIIGVASEKKAPEGRDMSRTKSKMIFNKEKWEALNDIQKDEIYRLKDITIDIECQIIDKYIEYGILDKQAGDGLKAKKAEYRAEMRKHGKIPGYYEKEGKDK